jgi:hypothetical protein
MGWPDLEQSSDQNSMGHHRLRPKLMPEKLLLIRQHLNASQVAMQQMLNLPKAGRVSQYENGVREPSLMVTLAYGYLGKVSMASIVDDDVSIKEFRKQLGKFVHGRLRSAQRKKQMSLTLGRR